MKRVSFCLLILLNYKRNLELKVPVVFLYGILLVVLLQGDFQLQCILVL
uniref:Uncharacterized protein n=1 Tax=Anguilla anguilla TaxID=7936 RepID=A0A0E9RL05_ANGAN